jgi:hypothetical protein
MDKRRLLLSMALVVALGLAIVVPASAGGGCTGCTPGYWKQEHHFDSWEGYAPGDYVDDAFECGPHITLLEALKAKGGKENALLRHAVAALLNAAHPDLNFGDGTGGIVFNFCWAWDHEEDREYIKDWMEGWNEIGCPLD